MGEMVDLTKMTAAEKRYLLELLEKKERQSRLDGARKSLLAFAHLVYPGFKEGPHHRTIAANLEAIARGEKHYIATNIAPRMGKSELCSYLFPAWFLGLYPNKKIIMGTHTASLSEDFGRRVRNLIDSEEYQEIFPGTTISKDQQAAGKWSTKQGGQYYAVGVGGAIAGRGADLFVIDDPHSENDMKTGGRAPFDQAWAWFQQGPLQRLMPSGAIVVIMTRWSRMDLTQKLIDFSTRNPDAPQWEVVELPAIMERKVKNADGTTTVVEKSLWPEQWPLDQLLAKKAGMDPRYWSAQYMQQPTSDAVAVIKREHWKTWEREKPPACEWIIQSWDTAYDSKTTSDFSACTTWGVWKDERNGDATNIILLDAFKARMEFPDLKEAAMKHWRRWEPDALLIEKKAAGAPLIQELRKMGLPLSEYTPHRGSGDKVARLNAVSDLFKSGRVWAPDTRWAKEVIDEVASFPAAEHDDYVDCLVGGTRILMADGRSKRIEDVLPGDMVATPAGPRIVEAAWCTGTLPTYTLTTPTTTLTGTANHPIATTRGWVRLAELLPADTIKMVSTKGAASWTSSAANWLCSMAERTVGTLTRLSRRIGSTSFAAVADACCIATCGNTTTGRFRMAGTCITSMATPATTTSATYSASPQNSIAPSIAKNGLHAASPLRSLRTLTRFVAKLLHGMPLKKDARGTQPTRPSTSSPAEQRTPPSNVRRSNAGSTRTDLSVQSVATRLKRFFARHSCVATRAQVVAIAEASAQPVYNLTVSDVHCFYANGVLTHNCTSMSLLRFRQGGFITLDTDDDEDDDNVWRYRKKRYY